MSRIMESIRYGEGRRCAKGCTVARCGGGGGSRAYGRLGCHLILDTVDLYTRGLTPTRSTPNETCTRSQGSGLRRVRVRVSPWTPGGIPVPFPSWQRVGEDEG